MSKSARDEKKLDRLGFTKYVKAGDGVSLRGFLEICQEASITGSQLSHVQ